MLCSADGRPVPVPVPVPVQGRPRSHTSVSGPNMAADAAVHLANVSLACGGARGARTCLPLAELTPTLVDAWWRDADTRIFDPRDVRNRRCSNCSAADQSWGLQVAPGVKSCSRSTERQEAFVLRLVYMYMCNMCMYMLSYGGESKRTCCMHGRVARGNPGPSWYDSYFVPYQRSTSYVQVLPSHMVDGFAE